MSVSLRWVSDSEHDRIAEVRALCYARAQGEIPQFIEHLRAEKPLESEYLLAERDGVAVGTATSIPQTMWVRGGSVPCQGVAWVGTIRTQRRRAGNDPGIGTALMREVIQHARDKGDVVSALMPFRGSYYEHFGYGFVERRTEWTIPLSILPSGEFENVRFYEEKRDREALEQCRQRVAQRGQCDIERHPLTWDHYLKSADEEGFVVVDRHGDGPVRGWISFEHHASDPHGPDTVRVEFDTAYEEIGTLKRFLHFLGSLRDQYSLVKIQLPHDLPLNLLLKETQLTHRTARNHPTAEARPFNRLQIRVLDHVKLLEAMKLPGSEERSGKVVVAIAECEGHVNKVAIEMARDGKVAAAKTQAAADVEMPDRTWSAIVTGNLAATRAAELGLISVANRTPLRLLDEFANGPLPYCREYF